jgi:DnaJ-class molecular chaperone
MSLHLTPNEPDDIAYGPSDPEGEECPNCEGTGMINVDSDDCHDAEKTCPSCGGTGFVEPPEYDNE